MRSYFTNLPVYRAWKRIITVIGIVLICKSAIGQCSLQDLQNYFGIPGYPIIPKTMFDAFKKEQLAKAFKDECFFALEEETATAKNYYKADGINCDECIAKGGKLKANQAYVWGLAKSGDNIWFGTVANTLCLVFGNYLGLTSPDENDCWTCQFGGNGLTDFQALPNGMKDWRPPRIFTYNITGNNNTDMTGNLPSADQIRLARTIGIRSGGSLGNVVFLAGPGLTGGVNFFAFNNATKQLIKSANSSTIGTLSSLSLNNIRKWITINGILYTTVGSSNGKGYVLRWYGDETPGNVMNLQVVGEIGEPGAEIAYHEGRIFISTWPGSELSSGSGISGLWMSPILPNDGLQPSSDEKSDGKDTEWKKVWSADNYEPDPLIAKTYGGGALASFNGELYWGTMHVPFLAALAIAKENPPADRAETLKLLLGSHRAISIFKGKNFGSSNQEINLLYGERELPVFQDNGWLLQANKMDAVPLMGRSGLGNFFNNYTWTMEVFQDNLYIGSMDWSLLLNKEISRLLKVLIAPPVKRSANEDPMSIIKDLGWSGSEDEFGADLFVLGANDARAWPVNNHGLENKMNYGIRTMLQDNDKLYLGMANPMNLSDDGGWELNSLKSIGDMEIIKFMLLTQDNNSLQNDMEAQILQDLGIIRICVPENVDLSNLVASFITSRNYTVAIDDLMNKIPKIQINGLTANNFTFPLKYLLMSNGKVVKEYWVQISKCNSTAVSKDVEKENIQIYPNPSKGIFKLANVGNSKISVFNLLGKKVYTSENQKNTSTLDLSGQANGIYLIKIEQNNNSYFKKIELIK